MKHIKTLNTRNLCESAKKGGCGECQTSYLCRLSAAFYVIGERK